MSFFIITIVVVVWRELRTESLWKHRQMKRSYQTRTVVPDWQFLTTRKEKYSKRMAIEKCCKEKNVLSFFLAFIASKKIKWHAMLKRIMSIL
jgi:hypothetical protein